MKSMTGYGRGYASREGREATIEVKSVNSRFLDLNIRMPGHISVLEESLRRLVSAHCDRGKVDLSVSYRNNREDRTDVQCDAALAGAYLSALRSLSRDLGVGYQPGLMDIAGFHGVLTTTEREEDLGAVEALIQEAAGAALIQLVEMRSAEGGRIQEDMLQKLDTVAEAVEVVRQNAPVVDETNRQRLLDKLQEFIQADETLRQRVLMEAAIVAEKRNIDEELVRLGSHLAQFRETLLLAGPVGRKLDFIVQEMNREVNTIGSKCNDGEIARAVILLKSELEKIREQVQNIE